MRSVLSFAAMALVAAFVTPKLIEHIGQMHPARPAAMRSAPQTEEPEPAFNVSQTVTITPDAQGHFRVEAEVDGRRLDFMVDTGASTIALTANDAARLGIRPLDSEYTARMKTANGTVKAAPMTLNSVEIDGLRVHDVRALVLPDESLSENLLGLSFLSRLRRFEYADGKLLLEQ